MEGLMSVFSATKRKARGYRSFPHLRTMLYSTDSHLDLPKYEQLKEDSENHFLFSNSINAR